MNLLLICHLIKRLFHIPEQTDITKRPHQPFLMPDIEKSGINPLLYRITFQRKTNCMD